MWGSGRRCASVFRRARSPVRVPGSAEEGQARSGVGQVFRTLPLIDEERLCSDVLVDNGRPNRCRRPRGPPPELFNLTDDEALEQLVQSALAPRPAADIEETHLPPEDAPQLPSSPRCSTTVAGWLSRRPRADHPALGIRTGGAAAGLHPHHSNIANSPVCSVRRCGCSFGP